jgi:hypothetical protein
MQNIAQTESNGAFPTPSNADKPTASVQKTSRSAKVAPKQASSAKTPAAPSTAPQVEQSKTPDKNVATAPAAPSKAKSKTVSAQTKPQPVKVKTPTPKVESKTVKPKAKAPSAAPAKPAKEKKVKVVRDSFTLPKSELLQISAMKKRALALGVDVKKSELIRAGLQALSGLADTPFKKALSSIPTIKTGRPAKD